MSCKVPKEQTHAYLDSQLTSAAVGELEEHLSICDNCREEMVFLKGARRRNSGRCFASATR